MQQLQHKQFAIQHTLPSLAIRYCYVPSGIVFTTGNMSSDDKERPWIER